MPGSPSLVGRAPGILSNHKARSRKGSRVQISLPAPNLSFESLFQKHFNQNMIFSLQMANDVILTIFNKGVSLGEMGKYEEAIECYDNVIERCDNEIDIDDVVIRQSNNDVKADALINKASSLWEMGQQKFGSKFQFKPIPVTVYPQEEYTANMIFTQAELDFLYAIIECCDKAIEIDDQKLYAWTNKGNTLVLLRNHEEAIECFDNALKIDDRDKMSWYLKGYELGQMKRIEEAIFCREMAEKLPED